MPDPATASAALQNGEIDWWESPLTDLIPLLKRNRNIKVDIADPRNVTLIVDGAIEIRIGNSHYIERLKILDQTLKSQELNPAKVRYIDLRFDDVVVGMR